MKPRYLTDEVRSEQRRAVGPWKVPAKVNQTIQRNLDAQSPPVMTPVTVRVAGINLDAFDDDDDWGGERLSDREFWS